MAAVLAHRLETGLAPDPSRVIARLHLPDDGPPREGSRAAGVVARVLALPETEVERLAAALLADFGPRHRNYRRLLAGHAHVVTSRLDARQPAPSAARTLLIGSIFTAEYAVEAAALCNPSAVLHPDQSRLRPGQARIALSLRAIGEGHLSTVGFATAVAGPGPQWSFQPRARPSVVGTSSPTPPAGAVYEVGFPEPVELSQQVLYPATGEESHGMEDVRFVRFTGPDGDTAYRATYTAYDGRNIAPRLLTTPDLRTFRTHRLAGPAAVNKGMALFPRLVGGEHLALCRSDGESNSLARSPDGLVWGEPEHLQAPQASWELLQIGNCGPPIETPSGWLVLTHGVGPMRTYSIGAILLDLEDPTRVLGRLEQPLLAPRPEEREGYVPNVLYSCGGVVHDGLLWLPYGIGDSRIDVAWVSVPELLAAMTPATRANTSA
jgi:predicted GH43/DUF377 family glycosyl hydrolase